MTTEANWQGMKWIRHSTRFALYAAQDWRCVYCDRDASRVRSRGKVGQRGPFSVDHLDPRARGGSNHIGNLVMCCSDCNGRKGDRTAAEYLAHLAHGGVNVAPIRERLAAAAAAELDRALGRRLAEEWERGVTLGTLAKKARGLAAAA